MEVAQTTGIEVMQYQPAIAVVLQQKMTLVISAY